MFRQAACNFVSTNLAKPVACEMDLECRTIKFILDLMTESGNETVQNSEVKQACDVLA